MHAIAAFFAGILASLSGLIAPTIATNSPAHVRTTQPAAAALTQTAPADSPFSDPAAASPAAAATPGTAPAPVQTVITQPVIERIIERVVPQGGASISTETLAAILADFERSISSRIGPLNPLPVVIPAQVAASGNPGTYAFFPASQRIDQLTNTMISTPTITGGTISNASISGSISGYLPLSGGTLTGALSGTDLSLSGTLSAGTLVVSSLSTGGALTAPNFTATSTSATSTFAGPLSILGTPVFSGGFLSFTANSTTTIPNNTPYAWTIATSTTGTPLLSIDTTSGSESVSFGSAGSDVIIGSSGQAANLLFQENSTISGIAPGRTITFGANSDILNFAVNVGFGTTTPLSNVAISGGASIGADYNIAAPTNGLIVQGKVGVANSSPFYPLDVTGFINSAAGGYKIDGANALYASSSASYLVAVGPGAGAAILSSATSSDPTSGPYNTAVGYQALNLATSSPYNTAVGYRAFRSLVAQDGTFGGTAVGYQALTANTTGTAVDAFGYNTLSTNTTGSNNAGLGTRALESNTTGSNNVAIGFRAASKNVTGSSNITIGMDAMRFATSSHSSNVAIGYSAGLGNSADYANSTGNVLLGHQAGYMFGNGSNYNTLIGYQAGYDVTTGSHNIILGDWTTTAVGPTTGSNNVFIGQAVRSGLSQSGSNQLNIGNLIFGSGLATDATLSTGNVGIRLSSPTYPLDVSGAGHFSSYLDASYIVATTSSATSTIAGGFTVGSATSLFSVFNNGTFSTTLDPGISRIWTFNGQHFLSASTTSNVGNIAFGYRSASSLDSSGGTLNTFIGTQAGQAATSTGSNTGIGFRALSNVSAGPNSWNGSSNTAIGANVGANITTGFYNNLFGVGAGAALSTGAANTLIGYNANSALTTGSHNVAIGGLNSAVGTLRYNVTGSSNTALGAGASAYNASATSTTAVGFQAAYGNGAQYNNQGGTVIGYNAGYGFQANSDYNTLLGYQAGYNITTGSNNIWIGTATSSNAIANLTTGSQNILIGNNISLPSAIASGQLNIGNIIFGTGVTSTGSTVSSANIGIGTSSPTAQLHTTGTVRFSNFGAGTLTTDASGNVSVSSDERLKSIDGAFTRGLADIVKLSPISYHWNDISGLDKMTQYSGFSAQNVQAAIPEAVGSSTSGYLTLQDRPLIAAIVNAIKELALQVGDFADRITTKELIATNGTFQHVRAGDVCVDRSDGTPVCITGDQLAALLAAAGQQTVPTPLLTPLSTPIIPPVIQVNGANPAVIQVGDTYADLGAQITGPQQDINLGFSTFLDGLKVDQIQLDTSATSTHTIDYVVTDTFGQTATATRVVQVIDAFQ
ncbi:immunoglobulin-like domain-containing protein [Methylocystis parvus]|uniref:immunoglobulin-like domain-containing protein n=1 Tax=Methylocystis parvus TaxID=134 RepID=UPI003C7704E2